MEVNAVVAASGADAAMDDVAGRKPPEVRQGAETGSVEALLGTPPSAATTGRWKRWVILGALALVAVVAGFLVLKQLQATPKSVYTTAPLQRGDLAVTVSATGALEPVNQVQVGSELSGTVEQVLVDDNSRVAKGQILATLDTSRLIDQTRVQEGVVQSARANLALAEATVRETGLRRGRLHKLYGISSGAYPARADIDAADAAYARAVAGAGSARAAISQATANLNSSRTSLTKAVIRSPVSGVVLSRSVEPGQTVAASLQAPVLFTLAEDMTRMELHVDIDEADVAKVKEGAEAVFTVDAFPGRTFRATVTRVGLGSTTKDGVVTYTGVLAVDNSDLSLRPGMTATAEITSERRTAVLTVPNAALSFRPPEASESRSQSSGSPLTPRMPRMGGGPTRRSNDSSLQQIWVLESGKPVRYRVRAGATDGERTEVSDRSLRVGMAVITGTESRKR